MGGARRERGWSGFYWLPLDRESRAHCVDLESAYVQGCERLEQAVLVREEPRGWSGLAGGGWENRAETLLSVPRRCKPCRQPRKRPSRCCRPW